MFRLFPHALMIGLTATPHFTPLEGYKTRGIVDPTEPWTKMFSECIHEMSLEEGMECGVLTELDVHLVKTNTKVGNITINPLGEYTRKDTERVFNTEARNYLTIGILAGVDKIPPHVNISADQLAEVKRIHELIKGKKTAIFGLSINHVEDLAVKLGTAGIGAMAVHSKLEERARQARFTLYDEGNLQVLLGVDLLRLGWDSPSTEVGIFLAPTRSGIVAVQELGRILRLSPETGKQKAVAIQLVDHFSQRSQAPVLIMDIFNPGYILRGTQTGLRSSEPSESKPQTRPVVTFSGMHIDSIFEEVRTRYLLQNRFKTADVMEMDKLLSTVLTDVQGKNPDAGPIALYQLFAKELPYFISSKNQAEAIQAVASIDSNVARAGTRVLTLINMKTIMSAAEPYLSGDTDKDSDLIQAGITNLMVGISKIRTGALITSYIYELVKNGIAQEIARRDGVQVGWARDGLNARIVELVEESLACNPFGLSKRGITDLADKISTETGISSGSVKTFIKYRNSLVQEDEVRDEEDLVNKATQPFLTEKLREILGKLDERQATVVMARFGLFGDAQEYTLDEVGKLIGTSKEWARRIEAKGIRSLRTRSHSFALRPFLYPKDYAFAIRKKVQPEVPKKEAPTVEVPFE